MQVSSPATQPTAGSAAYTLGAFRGCERAVALAAYDGMSSSKKGSRQAAPPWRGGFGEELSLPCASAQDRGPAQARIRGRHWNSTRPPASELPGEQRRISLGFFRSIDRSDR